MRLLDTDVMIDIRREYPPAVTWLAALPELPGLPGFRAMELVEGCRDGREVQLLLRETAAFPIYWPSAADQARAVTSFARAHLSHRLGLLDALIGECAVGVSATLCTFNLRHFALLPQLATEQPYLRS